MTTIFVIIMRGGIGGTKFETYRNIDDINIPLVGKMEIILFTAENKDVNINLP